MWVVLICSCGCLAVPLFRILCSPPFLYVMKKTSKIKKNKTLLVIDNNKIHQYLLDRIFVRSNYKLVFAGNKQEIFDNLKLILKFDLVLIELFLCDTDGFELIRIIKRLRNDITVIALTVCATKEEKDKCIEAGCDEFISKPFLVKNLMKIIDQTLVRTNLNGSLSDNKTIKVKEWP